MDRRLSTDAPHRPGFTLIEMMIVSGLMAFLAILLSSAWSGLGRSAADVSVRSQLLQELDLAVASLSRDLGGSFPIPFNLPPSDTDYGEKNDWKLVTCRQGANNEFGNTLELQYQKGDDKISVSYELAPDPDGDVTTRILVRKTIDTESNESTFTVARCLDAMRVSWDDDKWTTIELTFTESRPFAEYTRKCTLKAEYLPH